jgi:hypothetical protein
MVTHLGDQYFKYGNVPRATEMVRNGMRLAQDFAYCSEWINKTSYKFSSKKKLIPDIYMQHLAPIQVDWGNQPQPPPQPFFEDLPIDDEDDDFDDDEDDYGDEDHDPE